MSAYADRELRGWRRLRVARHLASCERCRAVLESLLDTLERLRQLGRSEPPPRPAVADAVVARIRRESGSR